MSLKTLILEMIESGQKASHISYIFGETYRKSNKEESVKYFHLLLCAAIQHNHTDLLKDLLEDKRCDVLTSADYVLTSLYAAISAGNVAVVELILRSSSSLKVLGERVRVDKSSLSAYYVDETYMMNLSQLKDITNTKLSPIEFACICDQREVLKLLVAYDLNQRKTVNPIVFRRNERWMLSSALQAAVELLLYREFTKMLTLSSIVRIILDMKTDDNAAYLSAFGPLEFLVYWIQHKVSGRADITTEECQTIVDAAHVLLRARPVTIGRKKHSLLVELLKANSVVCYFLSDTDPVSNFFQFIPDLIKQILRHCAVDMESAVKRRAMFEEILREIVACGRKYVRVTSAARKQRCRCSLDSVADICHYYMLYDPRAIDRFLPEGVDFSSISRITDFDPLFLTNPTWHDLFDLAFLYIVACSPEPGRLDNSIRLVLNCMSAYQIRLLEVRLDRMHFTTYNLFAVFGYGRPEFPQHVQNAIALLKKVEVLFSLQHLSRRAITRAMSYRCLDEQNVSTLGVPKIIQDYILQRVV